MVKGSRILVWAFVDWNSQIHAVRSRGKEEPTGFTVLNFVVQRIWNALKIFPKSCLFEISIRAYCGWHKGFEPTSRRKELAGIIEEKLFDLSNHPNMQIRHFFFGDRAAGALDKRLNKSTNSHFPATCRERDHKRLEEKMVDTALVSDLIYHAGQNDSSWLLVIGEDIDLMPGVYTAEGLIENSERQIAYLWSQTEKYLTCEGLGQFKI